MELESTKNPRYGNEHGEKAEFFGKATTLVVGESPFKLKERTVAIIDPKVMHELELSTGDVIEITALAGRSEGGTKIYAILWCGRPADHGRNIIRIDLRARMDLGAGIGDKVTIRKVITLPKAERVVLIHSERLVAGDLEKRLSAALEGTIVAVGMFIPVEILRRTNRFVVASTKPAGIPALTVDSEITRISVRKAKGLDSQVRAIFSSNASKNRKDSDVAI